MLGLSGVVDSSHHHGDDGDAGLAQAALRPPHPPRGQLTVQPLQPVEGTQPAEIVGTSRPAEKWPDADTPGDGHLGQRAPRPPVATSVFLSRANPLSGPPLWALLPWATVLVPTALRGAVPDPRATL